MMTFGTFELIRFRPDLILFYFLKYFVYLRGIEQKAREREHELG